MRLDPVQQDNYLISRVVFDDWFTGQDRDVVPEVLREAYWVRLVAALHTESGCRVLAHDGVWGGGGRINSTQSRILRESLQYPHQGIGHNGGSVGALQQIPTPVAMAATEGGRDTGAPKPWAGWGTIRDCMDLTTSIPKFLRQLRVTDDPVYKGKRTADPVVADLLRVQQPLASEVAANYGAAIVTAAREIAAGFPRTMPGTTPAVPAPAPAGAYLARLLQRSS